MSVAQNCYIIQYGDDNKERDDKLCFNPLLDRLVLQEREWILLGAIGNSIRASALPTSLGLLLQRFTETLQCMESVFVHLPKF